MSVCVAVVTPLRNKLNANMHMWWAVSVRVATRDAFLESVSSLLIAVHYLRKKTNRKHLHRRRKRSTSTLGRSFCSPNRHDTWTMTICFSMRLRRLKIPGKMQIRKSCKSSSQDPSELALLPFLTFWLFVYIFSICSGNLKITERPDPGVKPWTGMLMGRNKASF